MSAVLSALGWGAIAAVSLAIGAVLAVVRDWRAGIVGGVLSFGAGALISSISFELAQEGLRLGGPISVAVGLAIGALTFYLADRAVSKVGGRAGGGRPGFPWPWEPCSTGSRSRRCSESAWPPARVSVSPCW